LIVIVFDPLAVALIIAFNGLIGVKKKDKEEIIGKMVENNQKMGLYDNLDDLMEENYKDYEVYGDDIINENKKDETDAKNEETPVEFIDDMGNDTSNNEIIEEKLPHLLWEEYMHPDFPWNKRNLWINNTKAVNYWLKLKGGTVRELAKIRNEEENTKTY
jgi:hypothetical protein